MAKIPIAPFHEVDVAPEARNWVADEDGEWRRMGCQSFALMQVRRAINNLLAWHSRPTLSQAWRVADAVENRGSAPLLRFLIPDKVRNARSRTVTFIGLSPANTTVNGYYQYACDEADTSGNAVTSWWSQNHAGAWTEGDHGYAYSTSYMVDRGDRNGGDVQIGINAYNEMTVLAVCAYDDMVEKLDTGTHEFCDIALAKPGGKVLADVLDHTRQTFHRVRSENLPIVLQWSAIGASKTPTAPGNATGITVDTNETTGRVNLWDNTDVNGPAAAGTEDYCVGAHTDVWRAGIGPEWSAEGSKVPVTVRVYGKTVGADNSYGTVIFYGPSTVAPYTDNNVSVNVYNELAWYGGDSNQIYLNAAESAATLNVEGNRICVYGTVQNSGVPMHIYSVRAWEHWPYGTE